MAPGTLRAAAFAPERLLPAITGGCTDEQWRAAVAASLTDQVGSADVAAAMVADWSASAGAVVDEVAATLAEVRGTTPVVLVTNATSRLESDLERLGLLEAFDDIVNSSRVGVAKPDRGSSTSPRSAGAEVDSCLFVDDQLPNVEAVVALGMTGHHYRGPTRLREALGI